MEVKHLHVLKGQHDIRVRGSNSPRGQKHIIVPPLFFFSYNNTSMSSIITSRIKSCFTDNANKTYTQT